MRGSQEYIHRVLHRAHDVVLTVEYAGHHNGTTPVQFGLPYSDERIARTDLVRTVL